MNSATKLGKRKIFLFSSILLLLGILSCQTRLQSELLSDHAELNPDFGRIELSPYAKVLIDPSGSLTFSEIKEGPINNLHPSRKDQISFGPEDETIWLSIQFTTNSKDWVFLMDYPWIDEIDFTIIDSKGALIISEKTGDKRSFSARSLKYRLPGIYPNLKVGEKYTLFIRVASESVKPVRIFTEPLEMFLGRDHFLGSMFPIFAVCCFLSLLLNLFLAYRWRSLLPVYYSFFLISTLSYQALCEGYGSVYLYPEGGFWENRAIFLFGFVGACSVAYFWQRLLILPTLAPFWSRIIWLTSTGYVIIGVFLILGIINFIFLEYVIRINFLIFSFSLLCSGIIAYKEGFSPAVYSVTGQLGVIFLINIFLFATLGLVPSTSFTRNAVYIGYIWEFIFFFFTLSSRIKFLEEFKVGERVDERAAEKYKVWKKSRLKESEGQDAADRIEKALTVHKLYTEQGLQLQDFADFVQLRPDQLSEILNVRYGKRFNQLVNEYRVAHAIVLLQSQKEVNIIDIAFESGFNSKNTFNREFKKIVRMSPKEFRSAKR